MYRIIDKAEWQNHRDDQYRKIHKNQFTLDLAAYMRKKVERYRSSVSVDDGEKRGNWE